MVGDWRWGGGGIRDGTLLCLSLVLGAEREGLGVPGVPLCTHSWQVPNSCLGINLGKHYKAQSRVCSSGSQPGMSLPQTVDSIWGHIWIYCHS